MSSAARTVSVGGAIARRLARSVAAPGAPARASSAVAPPSRCFCGGAVAPGGAPRSPYHGLSRSWRVLGAQQRALSDATAGKAAADEPPKTAAEEPPKSDVEEEPATEGAGGAEGEEEGEGGDDPSPPTREEELESQLADLKDQLLRSLAEQENTRRIAKRDVDSARAYAVSSFAKSLLDTSDNLARALESVPPEYRTDGENHPVLATLYEGIRMTDEGLTKAFEKNGLRRFGEVGDRFDPHLHEALYEYPDPEKEPGTVGQVMKVGFQLNDRVIRPAEVGVVKKD